MRSKLTPDEVVEIRDLWNENRVDLDRLVDLYPVGRISIKKLIAGETWELIGGPTDPSVIGDPPAGGNQIQVDDRKATIKRRLMQGDPYDLISRDHGIDIVKLCRIARGEIWSNVEI